MNTRRDVHVQCTPVYEIFTQTSKLDGDEFNVCIAHHLIYACSIENTLISSHMVCTHTYNHDNLFPQYPVNLSTSDSSLPPTVVLNVSNTTELQAPSYDGRVCRNVLTKVSGRWMN